MIDQNNLCLPRRTICLIETDAAERRRLETLLERHYKTIKVYDDIDALITEIDSISDGCLIVSAEQASLEMNVLGFVECLRSKAIEIPIIVLGDEQDVQLAVRVLRAGASDFIGRPFTDYKLRQAVDRVLKD